MGLLTRGERFAPAAAPVDVAGHALLGELCLGLGAAIGAVGPDAAGGVVRGLSESRVILRIRQPR